MLSGSFFVLDLDLRTVDLDLHLDLTVAGLVTSLVRGSDVFRGVFGGGYGALATKD